MENKKYEVLITIRRDGKLHKVGELIELPEDIAKNFLKEEIICEPKNTEKANLVHNNQEVLKIENENLKEEITRLKEEVNSKTDISPEEVEKLQDTISFFLEKENLLKMEKALLENLAEYLEINYEGGTKIELVEEILGAVTEE